MTSASISVAEMILDGIFRMRSDRREQAVGQPTLEVSITNKESSIAPDMVISLFP
jgi:hypothetical protein